LTDHLSGEKFEQRDFEKPGLLFRFCLAAIHPFFTGPIIYAPFVEKLGLEGNERVLEFGCGNGVLMTYLAKSLGKGGSATGVDTSSYMTDRARKRLAPFSNAEILRGDIRTLELRPGSFDLVIFIHVLHDIAPEKRQGIMDALSRLLVPGGRLCLMEPVSPSHGMPVEEIRSLAESAGLSVTEIAPMGRRVRVSCLK
jgi:ubiquinone/menaquinone biosynthesis C-methylase UbiE